MDATRIKDSAIVVMKRLNRSTEPDEADIGRFFSSDSLASDPDNYCVPVHDALPVPDDENTTLIVMPQLWYWEDNPFETIGEAVEFFRQAFVVSQRFSSGIGYVIHLSHSPSRAFDSCIVCILRISKSHLGLRSTSYMSLNCENAAT